MNIELETMRTLALAHHIMLPNVTVELQLSCCENRSLSFFAQWIAWVV